MKKLAKKEREEAVNKGYLEDQDYVTKTYLEDRFNQFRKEINEDFQRHVGVLAENFQHQMKLGFESMEIKFDRLEAKQWKVDAWLSSHEDRISKLEFSK